MIKKLSIPFLLFLISAPLFAQTDGGHNNIYLSGGSGISVNENTFTRTWNPSPSLQLNVQVPFYQSYLEAGARYTRFKGDAPTETDSDFHSFFLSLGWLYPFHISKRYTISPGLRLGGNVMMFDEAEVFTRGPLEFQTDPREAEFAYELVLHNRIMIIDQLHLNATLSYNRTLTEIPLPFTMISIGFSYSFHQSKWLKNFLR